MNTTWGGVVFVVAVVAFDLWLVWKTVGRRPGKRKDPGSTLGQERRATVTAATQNQSTASLVAGATPARNCSSYLFGRKECALAGRCKHQDKDRPNLCTTRGFLRDDALAFRRDFSVPSVETRGAGGKK
jgi:hypothetical protein